MNIKDMQKVLQKFWKWLKPFLLGVIIGYFVLPSSFVSFPQTTIERQAALGGAAIPFPSGSPSPTLSASPPKNSKAGATAYSWMNISAPPLPGNPQADNGQTQSTRLFRPLNRRTP